MTEPHQKCAECQEEFKADLMVQFDDDWVCQQCKNIVVQKIKEGVRSNPITEFCKTHKGFHEKPDREYNLNWKFKAGFLGILPPFAALCLGGGLVVPYFAGYISLPSMLWAMVVYLVILFVCIQIFQPLLEGNLGLQKRFPVGVNQYIVELVFRPRMVTGFEAMWDSADDYGVLTVNVDGLSFDGDALSFSIPADSIKECRCVRSDWRGPFLGPRTEIRIDSDDAGVMVMIVDAREGLTLFGTRRANREIRRRFKEMFLHSHDD